MIIISFLLDGFVSLLVKNMIPLLTLTSIVISTYYIKENNLLKMVTIIGILYDVVYTDTIIINAILFFFLTLLTLSLNEKFNKNLLNLILINILIIIIYMSLSYFILVIYRYLSFDYKYFFISILKCLLINTIYVVILYMILKHKKVKFT